MNTQPKFSIGQKVWFMNGNEPICLPICRIEMSSRPKTYAEEEEYYGEILEWEEPTIRYKFLNFNGDSFLQYEEKIFATEVELCKAVFPRVFENAKITQ